MSFNLDQKELKTTKISLISTLAVVGALTTAIASHYGSVPESADLCFYPESAQIYDNQIRAKRSPEAYQNAGRTRAEKKLLFGRKYCKTFGTIPKSYLIKALNGTSNPEASKLAFINQGIKENWLYSYGEFQAENPYKVPLGLASILFSATGLLTLGKKQDQLNEVRPAYRAAARLESVKAEYAVALQKEILQMSGVQLLGKMRGLKEADSRLHFLTNITPQQRTSLMMSMNADDYHDYGYLLDSGASFENFLDPTPDNGQEVRLETTPQLTSESTPTNYQSSGQPSDRPKNDKYKPFRDVGAAIIQQAGTPGKSKALVAPSRTGKTTVLYFMLEETFKANPNTECFVWQGKGIEPVHPNIPRKNHHGFNLQDIDLGALTDIWDLYEERQQLLEQGIRDFNPVILIINDWQSIHDMLKSMAKDVLKEVVSKIMTLANNGAGLGTTVWIDTQSPNITDWGLGSASIRDNFDIFAIARIGIDDNGIPIGDTNCISKIAKNDYIIPNESHRTRVVTQFAQLQEGMKKGDIKSSVILSTAGIVRIGVTPEFERKELQFANAQQVVKDNISTVEVEEVQEIEEGNLDLKSQVRSLASQGVGYKDICFKLWPDFPLEGSAAALGKNCRQDEIKILTPTAEKLYSLLPNDWVSLSDNTFLLSVLSTGVASSQFALDVVELKILGYVEADQNLTKIKKV